MLPTVLAGSGAISQPPHASPQAQDAHNPDLRAHVLRGDIAPDAFVRMTATELANKVCDNCHVMYNTHIHTHMWWLGGFGL